MCFWGQRQGLRTGIIHNLHTATAMKDPLNHGHRIEQVDETPWSIFKDKIISTVEWVVTGDMTTDRKGNKVWQPFALAGDSGAMVFTNDDPNNRTLIGMIRAGDEGLGRWTFVTPIE